jgi:hypothetical protein
MIIDKIPVYNPLGEKVGSYVIFTKSNSIGFREYELFYGVKSSNIMFVFKNKKEVEDYFDSIIQKDPRFTYKKEVLADRKNEGKIQWSLVDYESLEPMVKALEFGANKYSRDNWKKGLPHSSIIDSTMRHITAIQKGENVDPESGICHIGHAMCNLMFLSWMQRNRPDLNDLKKDNYGCTKRDNIDKWDSIKNNSSSTDAVYCDFDIPEQFWSDKRIVADLPYPHSNPSPDFRVDIFHSRNRDRTRYIYSLPN